MVNDILHKFPLKNSRKLIFCSDQNNRAGKSNEGNSQSLGITDKSGENHSSGKHYKYQDED